LCRLQDALALTTEAGALGDRIGAPHAGIAELVA
jgi:hypothetical protein